MAGSHVYIDAVDSDHASRAINHAQDACLEPRVTLSERRVAFYALKDIKAGDELSFDYGEQYWLERGLAPEDDSRDYSPERVARAKPPPRTSSRVAGGAPRRARAAAAGGNRAVGPPRGNRETVDRSFLAPPAVV